MIYPEPRPTRIGLAIWIAVIVLVLAGVAFAAIPVVAFALDFWREAL